MEKGKYYASAALTCTPVAPAKVGDYYYSDGTYSTEMNEEKTCIGIVYALNDKNGNLDKTLTTSPYGRIVALTNARNKVRWASKSEDIKSVVCPILTVLQIPISPIMLKNKSKELPLIQKQD